MIAAWLASACGQPAADGPSGLRIHDAALVAPPGGSAALYLRVENPGVLEDRLVGFETGDGSEASLHRTVEREGRVRMLPAPDGFKVPAGGSLRLAPGGAHGMISGLPETAGKAKTVPVTLHFEKSASQSLDVPVVGEMGAKDAHSRHDM